MILEFHMVKRSSYLTLSIAIIRSNGYVGCLISFLFFMGTLKQCHHHIKRVNPIDNRGACESISLLFSLEKKRRETVSLIACGHRLTIIRLL